MKLSVFVYVPNLIGELNRRESCLQVFAWRGRWCALFKKLEAIVKYQSVYWFSFVPPLHPFCVYTHLILGYARLILIFFCWVFFDRFFVCLPLYAVSAFLDGKYVRV